MIPNEKLRLPLLIALVLSVTLPAFAQAISDILVEKSGPAQSAADTDVTYTVTVTNLGPDDSAQVVLNDPLPGTMTYVSHSQSSGPTFTCATPSVGSGGAIQCSITSMTAGSSAVFSFVMHIPPGTAPGTYFTNTATSTCATDPTDENNAGVATTSTPPPPQADMGVNKSAPDAAGPDTDVVYTLTVTNGGPDAASTVSFDDTLPGTMTFVSLTQSGSPALSCSVPSVGSGGTVTCTAATFAAGGSVTITLTGHIPAGTPSGTVYQNSATIKAVTADPNQENDTALATTTVSNTDLSVTKSGPGSVNAASDATYVITVANAGPDLATNVALNDSLPSGTTFVSLVQDTGPSASCATPGVGTNGTVSCSFATLASGASAQFTLVLNSGSASSINNTATVAASEYDSNLANNSASALTSVVTSADLSVTKSGPDPVTVGTDVTYVVTVANAGPSDASAVSLSDTLPAGTTFVSANQTTGPAFSCATPAPGGTGTITCTATTLAAGASAAFSFVLHVDAGLPAGSTLQNSASVSSSTTDPNGANGSATASATVAAAPAPPEVIPALSPLMLALLGMLLAFAGVALHRNN